MARQYAWKDDLDDEGTQGTDDLLAVPASLEARLRGLEQAVAARTRHLRDAARQRAEDARRQARKGMLDGAHSLEEYRSAMAHIDATLEAQLADVPAPPPREELRERAAVVVADAGERFYAREIERLEQELGAWRPALSRSDEEAQSGA